MENKTLYMILAAVVLVVLALIFVQKRRRMSGRGADYLLRPAGADGHTHSLAAVPGVSSVDHGHRHFVDHSGQDLGVVTPADHTHVVESVEGAGADYAGGLATFMGNYAGGDPLDDLPATTTGHDDQGPAVGGLAGFFGGAPSSCNCQPADED